MTDTLRLHYAPDNASLIIRLALEEMRLPYQAVLVDRAARAQDGTA
ncbi:glutathione S-transferase, partial [Cribrihabitans sp. XS_ASV171]